MAARLIVLCLPEGTPPADPEPDATAKREVELAYRWSGSPAGVVGWAEGGWAAVELAATYPDLVDRLVLVSTPVPEADDVLELDAVRAKALLLHGARDGGHAEATWWQKRLSARIEMVPGAGRDILERVWPRVLSHLAPRSLRK